MPNEPPVHVLARPSGDLEKICRMLAASRDVRSDLVDDIQGQMGEGSYMSEEKFNLAIYRMLRNILE